PIAEVTRLATITTRRQADRSSSGLLVRAAWANRDGRSHRPRNSIATAVPPPIRIVPRSDPTPAPAACGAIAPSRNTIGTSARSNKHDDQDEADDRADADPGERRDDDPRGAENYQGVAETRCGEFARHSALRAGARVDVTGVTSSRRRLSPVGHRRLELFTIA